MTLATATLSDGRTGDFIPEAIGDGAMKVVYFTPDRKSVVCLYKDAAMGSDPLRLQRLEKVLGRFNPTVPRGRGGAAQTEAEADYFLGLYCWPTAIVVKPGLGIVAPTYPANF